MIRTIIQRLRILGLTQHSVTPNIKQYTQQHQVEWQHSRCWSLQVRYVETRMCWVLKLGKLDSLKPDWLKLDLLRLDLFSLEWLRLDLFKFDWLDGWGWGCLKLVEIVWGWDWLRLSGVGWVCLRLVEIGWVCLKLSGVGWDWLRLVEILQQLEPDRTNQEFRLRHKRKGWCHHLPC